MSFVKYLCIDDQPQQFIQPMLDRLAGTNGNLKFHRMQPQKLEQQLDVIREMERNSEIFGLLLDLRLDEEFDEAGNKVFYRGPTLAQELRSRMADGEICSFPIVLWSMNDKIVHSYSPDSSSHDLFDAVYAKDDGMHQLEGKFVSSALVALAQGYKFLRGLSKKGNTKISGAVEVLNLLPNERDLLDPRLVNSFFSVSPVTAASIVVSLISNNGTLIDEDVLAAKLGADITASGESWDELKVIIKDTYYTGLFHNGWDRWWSHRVEAIAFEKLKLKTSLRRLDAAERITELNNAFNLSLVPASPIEPGYSTNYTTKCFATNKPLDSSDGFKIASNTQDPWLDSCYISTHALLARINKDTWHLDPLELERYKGLKEKLKNEEEN
ncbi:hypothetical protein [Pseudomonas sp. SID14000]|uniref:hypothetical protein n=1 Tax=Pseudomonas sp. SID14000 TaxID=1986221 RepID=UPI00111FD7E8|nr:hypothetical protein [Pseudomonas sp. SID14000]